MTQVVNNNDELKYILTSYGLSRVAEALADEKVNIYLSHFKVGDANFEYYVPSENQTELKHPIENGKFYIINKALLEDDTTISLHTVFPEDLGGCEIREVGIYEMVDGVEHLFAISTQQPLVKPSTDLRYIISVDYYAFLKSENLADIYDQIVLEPNSQLVTKQDLDDLMHTILFTESNLMEQIGGNSRVIGLNRAAQLKARIDSDKEDYERATMYNCFTSVLQFADVEDVFAHWVFDYSERSSNSVAITDLNKYGRNLSLSSPISSHKRSSAGYTPLLSFEEPKSYYLNQGISESTGSLVDSMSFVSANGSEDISFSMFFSLDALNTEHDRTLLARSNYSTGTHVFQVTETTKGELKVTLFSDSSNYITFTSGENVIPNKPHVVCFVYKANTKDVSILVDGRRVGVTRVMTGVYDHMSDSPSKLYAYTYSPINIIYADRSSNPTELYNADGTMYTGRDWSISNDLVFFGDESAQYSSINNKKTDLLYAWNYSDGVDSHVIYTKESTLAQDTILYNADYSKYTGSSFRIVLSGSTYIVQFENNTAPYDSTRNIPPVTLYAFLHTGAMRTIWANKAITPTVLYSPNGDIYTGSQWNIINGEVYFVGGGKASRNSTYDLTIPSLPVTSYIINEQGMQVNHVDSRLGVISVVKKELTEDQLRVISLVLSAALGNNPCVEAF